MIPRPLGGWAWSGSPCRGVGRLGDADEVERVVFRHLTVAPGGWWRRRTVKVAMDDEQFRMRSPLIFDVSPTPLWLVAPGRPMGSCTRERCVAVSDTHFGTERPEVVEALADLAAQLKPDLIVLSGDLTQRAREPEFAAYRAFVARLLPAPCLVVPGNHDIPLFDLVSPPDLAFQRLCGQLPASDWSRPTVTPICSSPASIVSGPGGTSRAAWPRYRLRRWHSAFAGRAFSDARRGGAPSA